MTIRRGPASNIYQLLDNELERLHEEARSTQSDEEERQFIRRYGHSAPRNGLNGGGVLHRIREIQDIILKEFQGRDARIQEKLAELVLTGDANEKVPNTPHDPDFSF